MSLLLALIGTIIVLSTSASLIAYWLVLLGRRIAGRSGMTVAAIAAMVFSAVPLLWAARLYWRLWLAGVSLRPHYGDQYLSYAFLLTFICVPFAAAAALRWIWRRHLPTSR